MTAWYGFLASAAILSLAVLIGLLALALSLYQPCCKGTR